MLGWWSLGWMLAGCARVPEPPSEGRLAPCWSSPNCVSTMADAADAQHYIAPVAAEALDGADALVDAVMALPGCAVTHSGPGEVLAECSTPSGVFTDDLHLVVVDGQLHARSSSRLGYGDLGVNRARLEALLSPYR